MDQRPQTTDVSEPVSVQAGRPSFVIGNSWQLNQLSSAERDALDQEPFVLVCNCFPEYWQKIGFRPTAWAFGDTHNAECCGLLAVQLEAICTCDRLRERLQHLFVCTESHEAEDIVARSELPITRYQRGDWNCRDQRLATNLTESVYHYGSSLTDVVNLALILNPGQEVRLCGCQYGGRLGHFYSLADASNEAAITIFPRVIERMWQGFSDLQRAGARLVDCNFEHDPTFPGDYHLPRQSLLMGIAK